ncbi:hypothetical protein BGZ89_004636 [Linnemannia elongata]|nr:hypothetical protein BGZ89_004636 [Linnemannia elongata]
MNVGRPVVDDARTPRIAVEDRTTASTVAPTVASADTPVVATANGGTASESGVTADDDVDSIAALKPTTADVTGALSENAVAADGFAVDERTASTTATTTTTVDTLAPVEETIIGVAQVVHVEDVSVSITAKTSSAVPFETTSSALAVSAITTSAAEETMAHSSANNGTSSAESTQRGKRTR